ncbi:Ig-like domain-containing protein [Anaeromicropila populeti]|uniref:Ig-like domain (Group 2) n=1 Tax=Anaeromicropila populeti TaxID=37658 RepID=A0A1I6JLR6_9FIRM|nr:hypothetical protein [Anaeromicropila populeti]SFR79915.1 hypothetical protein SAMN05661086_01734 [Anaeromicropila populeti]
MGRSFFIKKINLKRHQMCVLPLLLLGFCIYLFDVPIHSQDETINFYESFEGTLSSKSEEGSFFQMHNLVVEESYQFQMKIELEGIAAEGTCEIQVNLTKDEAHSLSFNGITLSENTREYSCQPILPRGSYLIEIHLLNKINKPVNYKVSFFYEKQIEEKDYFEEADVWFTNPEFRLIIPETIKKSKKCRFDLSRYLKIDSWITIDSDEICWSSSNSDILKISRAGKATPVHQGSVYISAALSNGKMARCKIIVSEK